MKSIDVVARKNITGRFFRGMFDQLAETNLLGRGATYRRPDVGLSTGRVMFLEVPEGDTIVAAGIDSREWGKAKRSANMSTLTASDPGQIFTGHWTERLAKEAPARLPAEPQMTVLGMWRAVRFRHDRNIEIAPSVHTVVLRRASCTEHLRSP